MASKNQIMPQTSASQEQETNNNLEIRNRNAESTQEIEALLDGVEYIEAQSGSNSSFRFSIEENTPDGNCLFRAISQAIFKNETHHDLVRKQVIQFILSDAHWPDYASHIICQHEHLIHQELSTEKDERDEVSVEKWKEFYEIYMSRNRTYGTLQELIAASQLYVFNLIILRQLSDKWFTFQEFHEATDKEVKHDSYQTFFFLFTGSGEDGHFELLRPVDSTISLTIQKGFYQVIGIQNDTILKIREVPNISSPPFTHFDEAISEISLKKNHSKLSTKETNNNERDCCNLNSIFEPINLSDPVDPRFLEFSRPLSNKLIPQLHERNNNTDMEYILTPKKTKNPNSMKRNNVKHLSNENCCLIEHESDESSSYSLSWNKNKPKQSIRYQIGRCVKSCIDIWTFCCCSISPTASEDEMPYHKTY